MNIKQRDIKAYYQGLDEPIEESFFTAMITALDDVFVGFSMEQLTDGS